MPSSQSPSTSENPSDKSSALSTSFCNSTVTAFIAAPKPVYPPLRKRLGEQGAAVHRVLIGTDGLPISAMLVKSSDFDRLDQAAYTAVMRWRYVPGKRAGVPTTMAFNVPINWVLE